jgi:STE24 endopeptidase
MGWLVLLRGYLGDWILVDELVALAPTLGLVVWAWWAYYPIDRRIREAGLIGRLDAGQPVYPIWSRGQYLLSQLRHQVALIFAPLLLLLGWAELVERVVPVDGAMASMDLRPLLVLAGGAAVFLFAPLMIRHLWDTVPLPEGQVRTRLLELCRQQGVGVRELLLWRTFGGMINAAVMGMVRPVRYILLTDALLDMVDEDEVQAIMAHELAHVRRHHMFWLLAAAGASLATLDLALTVVVSVGMSVGAAAASGVPVIGYVVDWITASPQVLLTVTTGAAALGWVFIFGWVSRRVERQADTFAVQQLSQPQVDPGRDAGEAVRVEAAAALTMIRALQRVAELNHIATTRKSWRHGSIAWRQAYLRSLVGQPVGQLSIDRQMRWIKAATLACVALLVLVYSFADSPAFSALNLGV